MLFNLERHVHVYVKEKLKWLLGFLRNELPYLEFHLTDHCNLKCKGCSHFSPLAPPYYASLRQHKLDMQRLRQLFRNIWNIRLMGGEPLLHQDPASFITATRAEFPESRLHFVTNGILLQNASANFWNACRNTNTTIDITAYPPLRRVEDCRTLCKAERVSLYLRNAETFYTWLNLKGDSNKQKAFNLCWMRYCFFLKEGRLYTCAMSALIHYFNKSFRYQIAADKGIDIHSQHISGRWVMRQLNRPVETCRWCSYEKIFFPWSLGKKLSADWDEAEHRKMAEQTNSANTNCRAVDLHR